MQQRQRRAVAIGFFDGVHIGHAALLNTTKARARDQGLMPSVLSFDVHPDNLVRGGEVPLLNSTIGRESIIRENFGIDNVVFLHFNRHMMEMPWQEFIDRIIEELDVSWIVVGDDFIFGHRGEGNGEKLRAYCAEKGLGCDLVSAVMLDGQRVSSTLIRELIAAGDMENARRFLGHPHILTDTVRSGYHLGRKLGAPTINMFFPDGVLVPRHGVYATRVTLEDGSSYMAVTNVGVRPSVGGNNRVSVESHLLDYAGNLYGRQAKLEFYSFLRPEVRFESFEALSAQIQSDVRLARTYFDQI